MRNPIICSIACLLLLTTQCSKDTVSPDLDVDAGIREEMKSRGIPSVVACVVKDDQIAWEGTYGYADRLNSVEADRHTLYSIMSISKLFLAVAAMQLMEAGTLDLDHDINQHLPFYVRNPSYPDVPITARMLLTHTSSLAWPVDNYEIRDFYKLFPMDAMPLIGDWLPDFILPEGSNYQGNIWKDYAPGTKELYSNIGTSLLAFVIEQLSGLDYRDYCKAFIFEPLQMHGTSFRYGELDEDRLAIPYMNYYNTYPLYNFRHYPAGNVKTNLEDFSHFMIAILKRGEYKGQRILESKTVDEMMALHNPTTGVSLIWSNCPGDCIGHSGGGEGFSTRAEWFMEHGKGMFIFSNVFNNSVYADGKIYELVKLKSNEF
jgi:CubicO group peptidase (beta-lactamase class C family)